MKNMKKVHYDKVLILPNIRSAINVGSIFRTADGVGVDKIYLVGYTPRPIDRFGRAQKDIAKSALGAETWIPWEYREDLVELIKTLKDDDYSIIALEQDKNAIDYRKLKPTKKMAFIVGPEVNGLDKIILKLCDSIVEIPMYGKKESLNVSVATGIALFRILN